MKSVIIQGLFCGFLAIGLWASMLLLFLHLEQEDMLENEKEELLKKRSLGKNAHQQTRHSEDVTHGKSDADEPGKSELYPGTNCDVSVNHFQGKPSEIQYLEE